MTRRKVGRSEKPHVSDRLSVLGINLYVALVCSVGTAAALAVWALGSPSRWFADRPLEIALVVVLIVVGELKPLPVARGDDTTGRTTISTTFIMALLLVGRPGLAIAVQGAAVVCDDLRLGRGLRKALFNFSQYAITLVLARAAFAGLAGQPFLEPLDTFTPAMLGPALVACVVFFVANNVLVATAVALDRGESPWDVLVRDIQFDLSTAGVMLCLAPVAALVLTFSAWMLPLLVLPIIAVYKSADLAVRREHEALHDDLTGLPNRLLLRKRATRALHTEPEPGCLAMLLLDLDHFKEINDTLGHQVGDDILCQVAQRLGDSSPDGSTVARLGGDEFAVVLPDTSRSDAEKAAQRLVEQFREPFTLRDIRLAVGASIGIALAPEHGTSVDTLLRKADIALYQAKDAKEGSRTYDPVSDEHNVERLQLLADVRPALDTHQFHLVLQPQISLPDLRLVGVEALVRWDHPRHGPVPPDVFLPFVENSGLSVELTREVLDLALGTVAELARQGRSLGVSVNLSARELSDRDLPTRILVALADHRVEPAMLTIEVTEGSIMADMAGSIAVLGHLRAMGVRVAVDDFGTGYSSLAYLKRLDVDELKIDRSFISGLAHDANDAVIVRSTIEMGHNLGLCVVAEGVEDRVTARKLREFGCDRMQGFHISRGLTPTQLARWANAQYDRTGPSGEAASPVRPRADSA